MKKNILIITNKSDFTADFLIKRLHKRKIKFYRFNTEDYPSKINSSIIINNDKFHLDVCSQKSSIDINKIGGIWYRRPVKPYIIGLEKDDKEFAERECTEFIINLWNLLSDKYWISDPNHLRIAERKAIQLKLASELNLQIPNTLISNNSQIVTDFINKYDKNVIVKPISHGDYKDGKYAIFTNEIDNNCLSLIKNVKLSPIIIQEKIEKVADVRANVFGEKIFC